MRRVKVSIINPTTLRLEEKGEIGDIIDLKEVQELDINPIIEAINKKKDEVYKNYLEKEIKQQEAIKEIALSNLEKKLKSEYDDLRREKEKLEVSIEEKIKIKILEIEKKKDEVLNEEKSSFESKLREKEYEIKTLQDRSESDFRLKSLELEKLYKENLTNKEKAIIELKHSLEDEEKMARLQINGIENEYKDKIIKLQNSIDDIRREKALRNVKQIGENLENWCNEKYKEVSLFGFKTCTWEKDNTLVRGYEQSRATKGDYIFKVYDNLESKNLLTSAMCEMKSEVLESENKKKNSSHYEKLDKDRKNKTLDYAILISELEYNYETDAPIFAVPEYDKMYVVRPGYFLTLLGIIESIGMKYSKIINEKEIEKIKFEDSNKIIDDFNNFKTNLLDNSIKHINSQTEEIKSEAGKIKTSADRILESIRIVVETHLNTVRNKINDYSIHSIVKRIRSVDIENKS
jgi:hypothetical protein